MNLNRCGPAVLESYWGGGDWLLGDGPKNQKYVIICIDATHSERFNHSQLKNVADTNGIKYIIETSQMLFYLSLIHLASRTEKHSRIMKGVILLSYMKTNVKCVN